MRQKILMTASTYGHIRSFHLPYLREFQKHGWETHVACAGIPDEASYIDRCIDIPMEKRMDSPANLLAARQLRRLIREERYDLIITHTTLAAFFTRLAVKGMKDRPKLVNVMHGYLFDDGTPFLKKQILLNAERLTTPETDLLLTMNEWDYREAQKYRLGKRIKKIPGMGVDFSRLDIATKEDGVALRQEFGIPEDAFVLLCAAEFSKRKSQSVLIRAMEKLPPNVMLVLCGSGALWDHCRNLARTLGVADRVFFPGHVADMAPWYRMADAAVSASRSEGLPFNVMEAMYMGLPVVASEVKGHMDLIANGETGMLYPYGDEAACAGCVLSIMDDPELRDRLCTPAKGNVENYALDNVLPEVMGQYLTIVIDRKMKKVFLTNEQG